MIIGDKQELKRCVKQAVRRAQIAERCLVFDLREGKLGVDALMDEAGLRAGKATPFGDDGAAFYAALDALELPARDLDSARTIQQSYDRHAYIREILDAMRARRVLVTVSPEQGSVDFYGDERLAPLLSVDDGWFVPGRYGVDYAQLAGRLEASLAALGAKDVLLRQFHEEALRYCVLPVCEDTGAVAHVHLSSEAELSAFCAMMDAYPTVRAVVSAASSMDDRLIDAAAKHPRMLICLSGFDRFARALSVLGTRFIPFRACAHTPEMMLGRWLGAKEMLWQALCDAYLPLARAGYTLDSNAVEQDVQMLLSGNIMNLYQ